MGLITPWNFPIVIPAWKVAPALAFGNCVVLKPADLAQAVELSAQSCFYSSGQRCTASSRLIVTDGIYPAFVKALQERMARIKVGDALAAGTDMGPVSSREQLDQDLNYIEIGKAEGATLTFGGGRIQCHTGSGAEGYFMASALFSESSAGMRINHEEIFGPVASVIRVKDYDAALFTANDTPFGLSAGIATTSLKYATHFKRHSQAGMVMVNLPTAGVDYHVPFGGRKGSSYGPREQGKYAQEFFHHGEDFLHAGLTASLRAARNAIDLIATYADKYWTNSRFH